ncbi:pyroglutamyl peptidase [Streptomyces sp. XM4193]|uniref:pyroglutamyl peptidase n=1 Tax=Streptomyces sp. XM4193 TaxID=2929782 RepID=UPI0027E2FA97|nr:pyroglutamyl peptidase [Streptomyces sp. XM4193]
MRIQLTGLRVAAAAIVAVPALGLSVPAQAAGPAVDCLGEEGATVEEARLDGEVPQEILRRSQLADTAAEFTRELCAATDLDGARGVVERHADALWRSAVERAQSSDGQGGANGGKGGGLGKRGEQLSAGDDRPLYWARLGMTSALNRWQPDFSLDAADRAGLVAETDRRSRGQADADFPEEYGSSDVKRVVVTGFDPFQLDNDVRQANPSGAAALALDGAVIETADGVVVVEAMLFPVRWRDFTDGMVERALVPHHTGERPADAVITVSQGREGQFDLEQHNGAWRGGFDDNENEGTAEIAPIPDGVPTVTPQPQWSDSTLDAEAVIAATDGSPFPVIHNTGVTEIPEGETESVFRPDGPTPGSEARAGGGGDYLSNEIAYRNTLLRDATEGDLPAGHVHTPILHLGTGDAVTDPQFEADRTAIVDQVRAIVAAAARP